MRGHCSLPSEHTVLAGAGWVTVIKLWQAGAECGGLTVLHGHVIVLLGLPQRVNSCLAISLPHVLLTGLARSHRLPEPGGEQHFTSSRCSMCQVCPAAEHMSCPQVSARGHTLPAAREGAVLLIYQMLYQLPDRALPQFAQGE